MQIIFSLDFVYAYGAGCTHLRITPTALTRYDDAGMRRFSRSRNALRSVLLVSIQMFSTAVFTIWLLYVWAQNSRFGSQPECTHVVKYVLFFASVHATATWLRAFFIVGIVFAACSLLLGFGSIIVSLKTDPSKEQRSGVPDEKVDGTGGKSIYKHFLTFPVGCVPPIDSLLHKFNFVR